MVQTRPLLTEFLPRYRHKSTILTQHQPVLPYTYTSTNRYHFIIHYLVTGIFVSFTTQYTWSSCHYNCYPHQGGSTGRLHYRGCHQHHHHRCDVGRAADQSSWRRHYSMSTLRHATLQHCNTATALHLVSSGDKTFKPFEVFFTVKKFR